MFLYITSDISMHKFAISSYTVGYHTVYVRTALVWMEWKILTTDKLDNIGDKPV